MNSAISTERLFSLPCFEGLRLFRKYMADHPGLKVPDLLTLLDRVEADAHSLDLGNLPAGIYMISVTTDKGMHNQRIQIK